MKATCAPAAGMRLVQPLPLLGHPPGVGRERSSLGEAKLPIRRKGLKLPSLPRITAEPEVRAGYEGEIDPPLAEHGGALRPIAGILPREN
ncbi:MAG: hypothetical protein EXS30_10200 [Pedosphaera sp.]|nr:hypothetical protein [Pedosphaera sp.]